MYRGLLGDFFFVKHAVGSNSFKMLIDCGVLQRIGSEKAKPTTSLGKDRIIAGVKDFIRDTGGSIDLMVATHEHYDHLSGHPRQRRFRELQNRQGLDGLDRGPLGQSREQLSH